MPCKTSSTSAPAATPSWGSTNASEQIWAPMPGSARSPFVCSSPSGPCLAGPVQCLFKTHPLEQCRPLLESLSQISACRDLHRCLGEEQVPASCEGAKDPHGGCCSCCPSVPGVLCRGSLRHNVRRLKGGNFQYLTQALQGSSCLPSFPSWHMPANRAAEVGSRSVCCDGRAGCSPDPRVPSLGSLIPLPQLSTGEERPCALKSRAGAVGTGHHGRGSAVHLGVQGAFCPQEEGPFVLWIGGGNRGQSSWRGR